MYRKYKKWMYVIIWMLVIFLFSAQTGESSSNNNKFVENILLMLGIDMNLIFKGMGSYIIRKAAHFTEYFILYNLLVNALHTQANKRKSLLIALLFTFLYACSDEIHQSFIPNRVCSFKDVLIDTGGGLLGLVIRYFLKGKPMGKDLKQ